MDYRTVLDFWFEEIEPAAWWKKDPAFDALIVRRFSALFDSARASELYRWRESAEGALAEIILLDQFSRNMFRDTPEAFAQDPMALALAQEAVKREFDKPLPPIQRVFMYLPWMHSESRLIHEEALRLYQALGLQSNLDFEIKHKAIIDRFGRFPHRNAVLGRTSTAEEIAFLALPGSSF
jgi:uncharacterized protein (DUF924 family)